MPTSEAQKKASAKWREKNRNKYNEIQREHSLAHYYNNKEIILEQKKAFYQANKEVIAEQRKAYYLKKKAEKLAKETPENLGELVN